MLTLKDLFPMTDIEFKAFENRLRRMAKRRGWKLHKSRRRNPLCPDYGKYMLVDYKTNRVVYGAGSGLAEATAYDIFMYLKNW